MDAGPRGPPPPCVFQGPRCGWMSCRHAGLCSGPRSGDGVIDMTAPPCRAHPSSRTRGAGRKVGHMCLVPCHEVSNLRPMGFVASFGSEQNSALALSVGTPPSPSGRGTICLIATARPPPARPHSHSVLFRGKGSGGLAEAALSDRLRPGRRAGGAGLQQRTGLCGTGRGTVRRSPVQTGQSDGDPHVRCSASITCFLFKGQAAVHTVTCRRHYVESGPVVAPVSVVRDSGPGAECESQPGNAGAPCSGPEPAAWQRLCPRGRPVA